MPADRIRLTCTWQWCYPSVWAVSLFTELCCDCWCFHSPHGMPCWNAIHRAGWQNQFLLGASYPDSCPTSSLCLSHPLSRCQPGHRCKVFALCSWTQSQGSGMFVSAWACVALRVEAREDSRRKTEEEKPSERVTWLLTCWYFLGLELGLDLWQELKDEVTWVGQSFPAVILIYADVLYKCLTRSWNAASRALVPVYLPKSQILYSADKMTVFFQDQPAMSWSYQYCRSKIILYVYDWKYSHFTKVYVLPHKLSTWVKVSTCF